jgi:hypothetical protein
VNGTLQEGNVMKLMEKSNEKGDTDLGYKAIEKCKTYNSRMTKILSMIMYSLFYLDDTDDCQNAYQMYSCGKQEAPVVFGKMVVWQEVTSEEVFNL